MAEISPAGIALRIPVIGELDERGPVGLRRRQIGGRGQIDQGVAPGLAGVALDLAQAELVAEEIERLVDVADPDHGVEILHLAVPPRVVAHGRFL